MKINSMKHMKQLSLLLGVAITGLFFQNCGQPGSLQVTSVADPNSGLGVVTPPAQSTTDYTVNTTPSSKFICEPFGGSGAQAKSGLKAQLSYIDPTFGSTATVKNAYSVLDYFKLKDPFVMADAPLYLSQINVPSRSFDQGFKLSDGTYLSDLKGNKLIEYFGLKMQSVLKLSDSDADGIYELATISDDGSILYLGSQDLTTATPFINNDGSHSTTMKCATQSIYMDHSTRLPMTYFYNQGPRTEITNVMVWRYSAKQANLGGAITSKSSLCGAVDRLQFWNPADSSVGAYFTQLTNEGYKILSAGNYELPDSEINPCSSQAANQIKASNFSNISANSATLNVQFLAAINATAQLYKIGASGNTLIASYDYSSQLNDQLSIQLNGLELGAQYALQFTLKNASSMTNITNEIKFVLQAQSVSN